MGFIQKSIHRPSIDLQGPDGNAYSLMSRAHCLGRELFFEPERIKEILVEMKSSNYKNLVKVFDNHFGEYVDLVLPDKWSWESEGEEDPSPKSFVSPIVKIKPKPSSP